MVDPALEAILRGALAALFLWASAHKARDLADFRATLDGYRLLPTRLAAPAALAVVAVEAGVGAGLLLPPLRSAAIAGAVGLLTLYSAAIATNLGRGRRYIDCGCAGPATRQPLSEWLVARNAVLIALALGCALPVRPRPLGWIDAVTIVGGIAVLAATHGAVNQLLANRPKLEHLRG